MIRNKKISIILLCVIVFLIFDLLVSMIRDFVKYSDYKMVEINCIKHEISYQENNKRYENIYSYVVDGKSYDYVDFSFNKKIYTKAKYNSLYPNELYFYQNVHENYIILFIIIIIMGIISFILYDNKKILKIKINLMKYSKHKMFKTFLILYIIFSFVYILIEMLIPILSNNFNMNYINDIAENLFDFIVGNIILVVFYFSYKIANKKFKNDKLSIKDFEKNKTYYCDLLNNYSPSELSYIDNFKFEKNICMVASLLSLKLKKIIDFKDNNIIILKDEKNISNNEKYILSNIYEGKLCSVNEETFLLKTQQDCVDKGLLNKAGNSYKKKVLKYVLIYVIFIFIVCFSFYMYYNKQIFTVQLLSRLILFILFIIYSVIAFSIFISSYYNLNRNNDLVRTTNGEVINEKLEGLKNFLKDFSNVSDKNEDYLILLEDYLIYSVIFEQNTLIVKNIFEKYILLI